MYNRFNQENENFRFFFGKYIEGKKRKDKVT